MWAHAFVYFYYQLLRVDLPFLVVNLIIWWYYCYYWCYFFQSIIYKAGFRSLGEGELVEFESKPSDKGVEATFVCGIGGAECRGSDRRPMSRKKFKKIRWVTWLRFLLVIHLVHFLLFKPHRNNARPLITWTRCITMLQTFPLFFPLAEIKMSMIVSMILPRNRLWFIGSEFRKLN